MADEHDIVVTGGTLIDGTGSPKARLDLAIDGDRVSELLAPGTSSGRTVIDAAGMVVCPGFVDIHTHSDLSIIGCPLAESKIRQGVTTEVMGNCGSSAAPLVGEAIEVADEMAALSGVSIDWTGFDGYLSRLETLRPSVNVASLVGADTVRTSVLGAGDVQPTREELDSMKALVADAMAYGAYGLSSGLIYAPGCYASTDELISLAELVVPHNGVYASHIRGEGRTLIRAVAEAISIGRKAGVRVQISHHKAAGSSNWGIVKNSLRMIEEARASGIDVAFDVYPYTASCTNLYAVLPPWVQDGGRAAIVDRLKKADVRERIKREFENPDTEWENTVAEDGWENIELSGFRKPENNALEHKRLSEIGEIRGVDPADAAMDLLLEEGFDLIALFHEISDDDVVRVISHPLASVASDGEVAAAADRCSGTATHPRAFGTFPRAIRVYSIDRGIVSLEEIVRKMTSAPADRMGFQDRGRIASGMKADVVVFDPTVIRDTATYAQPHSYAEGIVHVLVNGVHTIVDGEHTGQRAGAVLRKSAQ